MMERYQLSVRFHSAISHHVHGKICHIEAVFRNQYVHILKGYLLN